MISGGGNSAYAASKHAVVGLSEVLREELRSAAPAVGVTVLCPGPVSTHIRESARNRPANRQPTTVDSDADPAAALPHFEHRVPTVSADEAAYCALAAVETDQFWALTNPGNAPEVRGRIEELLADLPDQKTGS